MRPFAAVLAGLAFTLAGPAFADDPVKPEIGAGPHRDRSAQTSGAGEAPRDVQPVPPGQTPGSSAAGADAVPQGSGASTGPSRPDTVEQQEDEKKASQAKEKMKRKPGFQDEAPSPRASRTGLVIK